MARVSEAPALDCSCLDGDEYCFSLLVDSDLLNARMHWHWTLEGANWYNGGFLKWRKQN
jgi:hypothetical protein